MQVRYPEILAETIYKPPFPTPITRSAPARVQNETAKNGMLMKSSWKPLALIHSLAFAATAAVSTEEGNVQDAQRWAFVPIVMSNAETGMQGGPW